ncbi:hypothetical protein CK203_023757 [Vitis vinifera]|uniref:Uncharacterized protein n=1 Tax=Vitis vinifera TaxID=29760 RepID=A0A438JAD3_VITVI|nr:hypothetical protein CK203_023757 [Vitis vinifera]
MIIVEASCYRGPRGRQMDAPFQLKMIPGLSQLAKDVRTHHPIVLLAITLMVSHRSWGIPRWHVVSIVARLGIWSTEELHSLNRESRSLSRASTSGIPVIRAIVLRSLFPLQTCARSVVVFRVFSGGFAFALGPLGLLLPPYCFAGLWGRVSFFDCWHFAMQVSSRPHALTCLRKRAPVSSSVSLQRVPSLHSDSSDLCSSQYSPSVDGVQHPEYAVQLGSFLARGPIYLHHQEREDKPLQPVCPYPVPSTGVRLFSRGPPSGHEGEEEEEEEERKKKKKKTIAQAIWVVSSIPDLSSSSFESVPSRPDNLAPEPEDTSGSPQLETFLPGLDLSASARLRWSEVVHEPEEVRDMNDLRTGFSQRHRKLLYDPIDLAPSPAKKVCPERGSGATAAVQADAPGPSSATIAQPGITAHSDAPATVETRGLEGVPEAMIDEEALDEKSSPAAAVPPSWEEMMEMLKGVPCFMDAEVTSTRMSNFFPLTKRVSMNMGGDPPSFVKVRLPFGTPESAVSCIQHLQEWTIPETAEVVVAGIHYMMHTREHLFKRLEVVEAMCAFISYHLGVLRSCARDWRRKRVYPG